MKKISTVQKGFSTVEGLLLVLILLVIGGIGYMVYHNDHQAKTASVSSTAPSTTKTTAAASTYAGWQTYSGHGFTAKYPPSWVYQDITGNDSNGIANDLSDITFSNHSIVTGVDASPYPIIDVTLFSAGYIYDSSTPAVSSSTDLTAFVRANNGLIPSEDFSQVKQQTETIGGAQAIKFVGGDFDTPWTMKVGSNIYQFTMANGASNPINSTTLKDYFSNFLASFQLQ